MLRPKSKPAEPSYAQRCHMETIDRCAADLTAAIERAIGVVRTREVGAAAAIAQAVREARIALLAGSA